MFALFSKNEVENGNKIIKSTTNTHFYSIFNGESNFLIDFDKLLRKNWDKIDFK